MKVILDRHARRRMRWRRITSEEVLLTLKAPDTIEKSYHEKWNAFKTIGKRYIRVTYKKERGNLLVISVVDKND